MSQREVVKVDAFEKASGSTKYVFDLYFPRMLHAKVLRSPLAHARIKSINVEEAKRHPGVRAVISYLDVPNVPYNTIYNAPDPRDPNLIKEDLIFDSTVRYVGAPIAAVAAEDEETAERAVQLIEVEYEELPTVFDPEEAMKPQAPKVRPNREGNIATTGKNAGKPITVSIGDLEKGFHEAEYVFEGRYETQRVHQYAMETLVCICGIDASGKLDVWSSTQSIHGLRANLAQALNIPVSRIMVHKPMLGGAFGSKLDMKDIDPICASLAMKTRRPVRLECTREEFMGLTPRHPTVTFLRTGVNREGKITARYCKAIFDIGATANHGPIVTIVGGDTFLGAYKTPNMLFEGYPVYTNNPPSGAMRGYGGPQINFAIECHMDEIARELGLDPIEFRLLNAYNVGDVSPKSGFVIESCGLKECAKYGAKVVDWAGRRSRQRQEGAIRRGVGVAFSNIFASGVYGLEGTQLEYSGAIVKLNEDGTVNLITAVVDQGAGQSTVLAQIAAEELGVRTESVVLSPTDTENSPFDVATHASRITYVAGYASRIAAIEARQQLLAIAAELLKTKPNELEIVDGTVFATRSPEKKISIAEVAWYAHYHKQITIMGKASTPPPGNPPPFGVVFVEVEVNTKTGNVRVSRVVDAHDVGRVVNILGAEGQFEGAVAQAIGYALYEELVIRDGRVINPNIGDYKLVTRYEMPEETEIKFIETKEPSGVGAKGFAESVILHIAPAIANAIYDAIGIRFTKLPITPEVVLKAIKAKKSED